MEEEEKEEEAKISVVSAASLYTQEKKDRKRLHLPPPPLLFSLRRRVDFRGRKEETAWKKGRKKTIIYGRFLGGVTRLLSSIFFLRATPRERSNPKEEKCQFRS